jgi:DNA polymerase I-like protein with 3'-5' exonuclease and polymerase domains
LYVTDPIALNDCINYFRDKPVFGFDTETTSLDPRKGKLLSLQLGNKMRQYVIAVSCFTTEQLRPILDFLENPNKLKIGHNLKFDFKWMYYHYNIVMKNMYDTYLMEVLLNQGKKYQKFDLNTVIQIYDSDAPELDKGVREEFANADPSVLFTDEQVLYSKLDVKYLISVYNGQRILIKDYGMEGLADLENRTICPTAMMELNGIYLDKKKWMDLNDIAVVEKKKTIAILDEILKDYDPKAGQPKQLTLDIFEETCEGKINYDSNQQVKKAVSWALGEDIASTGVEELKKYRGPIIEGMLDLRMWSKRIASFGEKFLKHVDSETGRIYASMWQLGTDSGRYSSSDPNLQQIPKEQVYRTPFCAQYPETQSIISADYSSMELRIIAELSQEPSWIDALKNGYDLHSYVAAILFDLDYFEITENNKIKKKYKSFRNKAKSINFGR